MTRLSEDMVRCPNCGAENVEGNKYCGDCGKTINDAITLEYMDKKYEYQQPIPPVGKSNASGIVIAVVGIVIVIVILLVLLSVLGGSGIPGGTTSSGTVSITIHNSNWFSTRAFSLYIDGDYKYSGSLPALSSTTIAYTISWSGGDDVHPITITVTWSGDQTSETIYVMKGRVVSPTITIDS